MTTLFKHVLDGIQENNAINGAKYNDFQDAEQAIEVYGGSFKGECDQQERSITVQALNMIIESNGEKLHEVVSFLNESVWGRDFANNTGPTPFG